MACPAYAQNKVLPLWVDGALGFEARKYIPERAKDWWVRDIHNPSQTLFSPAFVLSAFNDAGPELTTSRHLDMSRTAGVAAEMHKFAQGGHAFNMGD